MSAAAQAQLMTPWVRRFTSTELLIVLAFLFTSFPFIEKLRIGGLIESILITVVLLSAVMAISGRRNVAVIALLLAIPTLAGRWIHHFRPDLLPPELFLIGGMALILFVTWNLLSFALTAKEVNIEVLCASISAYLLLGCLCTFAYCLGAEVLPDAFLSIVASAPDKS